MRDGFKGKLGGRELNHGAHERVERLPRLPSAGRSYWLDSPNGRDEHTHQLFRFPAKFHPPVVRWALGNYGRKGSVLLDPFTGSGTAQVEALLRGISSVGIDIDPLACLIAQAKCAPINPRRLEEGLERIEGLLHPFLQRHSDRETRPGSDISEARFERESSGLALPAIPNITHWFRRYVIVDLARIFTAIAEADLTSRERQFFRVCAAAVIRGVSNADPAPVSGLEVTSMQEKLNPTRKITVFKDFCRKVRQKIEGMRQLWEAYRLNEDRAVARVIRGNSLDMENLLQHEKLAEQKFPLVVTSPPYCSAVAYSRRHRLEMYWLDLVKTPSDHSALAHSYLGRPLVRSKDWDMDVIFDIKPLDHVLDRIGQADMSKARTLRFYFSSMAEVFRSLRHVVRPSATVVCVIGDSVCCKVPVRTSDYVAELVSDHFSLTKRFSYALRNHYMQYGLWNGDGIKEEHVLVFKPRNSRW